MNARRRPRSAGQALREVVAASSPGTLLASAQAAWRKAVGPALDAQAQPVAERDGTLTVACRSATWAQELDLMQEEIRRRLNDELGEERVKALRFTADGARSRR